MNREQFLKSIEGLSVWSNGDIRAPHKPLALLYAFSQLKEGVENIDFNDFDIALTKALKTTLPMRKAWHSHYPFWYLKNNQIWEIHDAERIQFRNGKSEPLKSELQKNHIHAGFANEAIELLKKQPDLISESSKIILDENFPESLHEEILQMFGLCLDFNIHSRQKRDPSFRERIMKAYGYRCAVCSYGIRLNDTSVGLEAAHIKWHQAGGPDLECNGLALCSTHHILFDKGAYTIAKNLEIQVSESTNGEGLERILFDYHGERIREPKTNQYMPDSQYLEWHHNQVFAHPAFLINK